MEFGGNTRHLGLFGEETDEITDLHQILEEVLLTAHEDGVTGITRRRRDPSSDGVRTLAVDANSNCMERQMLIHFHRERDANCADAQDLMRLIVEVEERMNHSDSLIREVEILTDCILVVEAPSKSKRVQGRDVEKLRRLNEMVSEARREITPYNPKPESFLQSMADSSKGKDSTKLIVTDEIIEYVWAKYGNKWQVGDATSDVILDDLLQKKFNEQERAIDDKTKLTGIKCVDNLKKRIQNVEKVLYKAKEKMLMEKGMDEGAWSEIGIVYVKR
nr:hypothetical protein [Tanacetum cinerariifolium]